jgi:hypothetical protein
MGNHSHLAWLLPSLALFFANVAEAAAFQDGRISQVVRDVRVAARNGRPVRASSDTVLENGALQTGSQSRAEICFRDHTVARLGDKTVLGVNSGTRTFDLESGAVLTQVPTGVGRTILKVGRITATATGATLAVECLPNAYTKFIALDGTSRLCLNNGGWGSDCMLLRAGQMMIASPEPKALPDAVDVDLNRLLETCRFITEFPPLPGHDGLVTAAAAQRKSKSHGIFAETNLVILGRGTLVTQRNASSGSTAKTAAREATASGSPRRTSPPTP